MTFLNFHIIGKPLQFYDGKDGRTCSTARLSSLAKFQEEIEPEKRLWKICQKADSPNQDKIESIAFLLLGILAAVALCYCSGEMFQLNGTIGHAVQAILAR